MKLTTWTIYKGKNLKDIDNKVIVKEDFPFLLLRPDLRQGNEFLGLAIVDQFVASMVVDLINRELNPNQLTTIFKDKMGLVSGDNLMEYQTSTTNFSKTPILEKNIQNLMETYNILIKSTPITFQSEDYDNDQKVKENQSFF